MKKLYKDALLYSGLLATIGLIFGCIIACFLPFYSFDTACFASLGMGTCGFFLVLLKITKI